MSDLGLTQCKNTKYFDCNRKIAHLIAEIGIITRQNPLF